jgi:hypothetical protein
MELKPETFAIGVIDFFSVMLPGAVVSFLVKDKVMSELGHGTFPAIDGEAAGWAMFLFCSYLLGHFIFLAGSKLDDWIYQRIREATKPQKPGEKPPWASTKWLASMLFAKAPDRAVDEAGKIKQRHLDNVEGDAVINTFQWAKARLAINCPGALGEVQRLEADSKFFRSFAVVLMLLLVWTSVIAARGQISWWMALICLFLVGLSLWRYIERRFKATQQAYWYVLTLEHWPPSSGSSHP